jgi:hypothetical protein
LNGEAVEKIIDVAQEAVQPQIVTLNGVDYATQSGLVDVRKVYAPERLLLHTLTGFVDYAKRNVDGITLAECIAQVDDNSSVRLMSKTLEPFCQRFIYAHTQAFGGNFSFGRWLENEDFIIALQTLFVDDLDRAKVLSLVGTLRDEDVKTGTDDGITQVVTARRGISLAAKVAVPNPVNLRPWRTFREVEQPASPFILRLKPDSGGGLPLAALFEADGGSWGLTAIATIAKYLREQLAPLGIEVIA